MSGAEKDIGDASKEPTDKGSDAMLVEETENSSSFTQTNEVILFFLCMFSYDNV
jgi:hypothetical protein